MRGCSEHRQWPRTAALAGTLVLSGCALGDQTSLAPQSDEAGLIADLWWTMFWMGAAVYALVLLLLGASILRSRKRRRPARVPATGLIWAGGVVLPAMVVVVLTVLSFSTARQASPSGPPGREALQIEVTGYKFWWDVRYPEEGIVTANEITIPAGERVEFVMGSADVIHSFWVPPLHGKVDMVPGRTTRLQVQARETGIYRGQCAEYCGTQHANMAISVAVLDPQDYRAWVRERQEAAAAVDSAGHPGREVFLNAGCAGCHALGGSAAPHTPGPDLTHLMSRRTIGAGRVANNRGFLGGWVVDPQGIKPGSLMPPTALQPQELIDLLDYLETLE